MARRPRKFFKASPWELEDAEEEQVEILINHAPKRFVSRTASSWAWSSSASSGARTPRARQTSTVVGHRRSSPPTTSILAIGQENAFPWIERDIGIEFDKWDMPVVDKTTFQSTRPGVFFGGDAAWGPKNIIWAVAHGHEAAISIHNHCQGVAVTERPRRA